MSLECWVIRYSNHTTEPNLLEGEFLTSTKKHPSPDTNPTNQFGSKIDWSLTIGLLTGNTLEKAAPNLSGNPQLIDAFIATNFLIPSIVKCSLFFTTKKASFIKE